MGFWESGSRCLLCINGRSPAHLWRCGTSLRRVGAVEARDLWWMQFVERKGGESCKDFDLCNGLNVLGYEICFE